MSRGKPRVILQVEDIATGRPIAAGSFVDDWGQEQAMQVQPRPSRGLPSDARDHRDRVNRAKQSAGEALLSRVFDPPQPKPFKRRM